MNGPGPVAMVYRLGFDPLVPSHPLESNPQRRLELPCRREGVRALRACPQNQPQARGSQWNIVAGVRRRHWPAYIRFFCSPLEAPLHLKPLGPPARFPVECGGILGKNARTSTVALLHGMPQAVTMYRLPRRGGAFGVWTPHTTHVGPVIVHRVVGPFGIAGMGGGCGGGGAAGTPSTDAKASTSMMTGSVSRVSMRKLSSRTRKRSIPGGFVRQLPSR
jgi:hypothetical protein